MRQPKEVFLLRFKKDEKQSTGTLVVIDFTNSKQPIFNKTSIERGDRNNEKNVSCVPEGTYPLVLEYSPRYDRKLWELKDVPGRSECKIHPANYAHQLNGCIAPGDDIVDMNNDGYVDITNSKNTVDSFHKALEGLTETVIHIVDLTIMTS